MRLLILGGTEFAGRAVAQDALRRHWEVTVLNRGNNEPPPGVRSLRGDRTRPDGLDALQGSTWDVVVDTWNDAPSIVRDSARTLSDRVERYVYVSSRSVYTYPAPAGLPEDGPLVDSSPDTDEAEYAQSKRGAELAAQAVFGDRALLVRAGLILGPHENAGRLLWWLRRIARGGRVLAPGPRELPLQYIDVRDLARWTLDAAERGLGGAYNVVSERGHTTMGELLDTCVRVTGADARLCWLAPEVIHGAGIQPWTQLPIWLPPGELHDALYEGDVAKALASGLRCRPCAETVADTWDWLRGLDGQAPALAQLGLDPATEATVLEEAITGAGRSDSAQ